MKVVLVHEYCKDNDTQGLDGFPERKADRPAISIDAEETEVVRAALNQNFVPIVDSRNTLCGIITRRGVTVYLAEQNGIRSTF